MCDGRENKFETLENCENDDEISEILPLKFRFILISYVHPADFTKLTCCMLSTFLKSQL